MGNEADPPPNLFTAANTEPLSSGRVQDPSKTKGNRNCKEQWRPHGAAVHTSKVVAGTRIYKWNVNQILALR
ncbi:hypothetical protein ACFX13_013514 [Malus domestica]